MPRLLSILLAMAVGLVAIGPETIATYRHPNTPESRGYVGLHDEDPNGAYRGVMEVGWGEGEADTTVLQLFPGEFQVGVQQDGEWTFPLQGAADGVLVLGNLRVTGKLYLGEAGYLYAEGGDLHWYDGSTSVQLN